MTDKSIDELVAAIDANTIYFWDGRDVAREAAVELASIARGHILESVRQRAEAEHLRKERDWLARKCEWLESQTVNAQKANTWDSAEQYIAAAREAAES
jgi:hypothetical protein